MLKCCGKVSLQKQKNTKLNVERKIMINDRSSAFFIGSPFLIDFRLKTVLSTFETMGKVNLNFKNYFIVAKNR
jgi:hypothetical protein